jgi:hypothetical protein
MLNVEFEGAQEIGKPPSMTDEQCSSAWALPFDQVVDYVDDKGKTQKAKVRAYVMCYQPSKEDMEAIAAGGPIWLKIIAPQLTPHALWTHNPLTGDANF